MIGWVVALVVLLALALVPLGIHVRYDDRGLLVQALVGPLHFLLFSSKNGGKKGDKSVKKQVDDGSNQGRSGSNQGKGGSMAAVKAALPLIGPALEGVKRRLTIRTVTLHVVWAAADPADAASGYGYAQAALGTIWPWIDRSFRVKHRDLGVAVDFDAGGPTVLLDAVVEMRLYQAVTLAIPLLVRFIREYRRVRPTAGENTIRKEA